MFGNRFFYLKLFVGIAAFAGACRLSAALGREINPSPMRAKVLATRHDGAEIWVPGARVVSVADDRFVVMLGDFPLPVHGRPDGLRPGDDVEMTGLIRAGGPTLELKELRRIRKVPGGRWLTLLVSALTTLGVLLLFLRRFQARGRVLEIQWRT